MNQEQLDFEKRCKQLIGLTLLKVEYSEIVYDPTNPKPAYQTQFTNLHSVDFSIFLHTDKAKLVEIYWDEKFFQYGIGIKFNEKSNFTGSIKWDVSNIDFWKQVIGSTISNIQITWETVMKTEVNTEKTERTTYPQDIKITFSDYKNIFISASNFIDKDAEIVFGMSDNLMVTDNDKLARQVKMIN